MSLPRTAINRRFLFNRMPNKSRLAFSVIASKTSYHETHRTPIAKSTSTSTTEAEKTQRNALCPQRPMYKACAARVTRYPSRGKQLYCTDRSVFPVLEGILCAPRQTCPSERSLSAKPADPAKHSAKDERQRGAVSNVINASAMQS